MKEDTPQQPDYGFDELWAGHDKDGEIVWCNMRVDIKTKKIASYSFLKYCNGKKVIVPYFKPINPFLPILNN